MLRSLLQLLLAAAILAGAVAVTVHMVTTRASAERADHRETATLVETLTAHRSDERVVVPVMGTVMPSRELAVFPEVTGAVVEQNPRLVPGGCLAAGDLMVRIDDRDYRLVVEQQQAAVEKARFDLQVEEGRQVVAQREWQMVGEKSSVAEASEALALRKPHLALARASLDGAISGLRRAELNRERTVVRAPFNAIVVEEFVDLGQIVTPGTRIARLIGADQFWVRCSIPLERLEWLALPDGDAAGGAPARVIQHAGAGEEVVREGRVIRLLPDLDPAGRMARLLVAVDNPLGGRCMGATSLPLLSGAYVRVELDGRKVESVVALPRAALHEGDRVWIMGADDRLVVRPVTIVWRRRDDVLVTKGLEEGDRIVTSRLGTPVPGMRLRVREVEPR